MVQRRFPPMSQQIWCLLILSFLWSMVATRQKKKDRQCTYNVILACAYNQCSLGNKQCIIPSLLRYRIFCSAYTSVAVLTA
jgi:hypothetical protein